MQFYEDTNDATYRIRRYENGEIFINQTSYRHPLLLTAHHLAPWQPAFLDLGLAPQDWDPLLALQPKILLIGTGKDMRWLPPARLEPLITRQIGYEWMTTEAACRTFTILTAEARPVCAILYP